MHVLHDRLFFFPFPLLCPQKRLPIVQTLYDHSPLVPIFTAGHRGSLPRIQQNFKIGKGRPGLAHLYCLAVSSGYQAGNWLKILSNLFSDKSMGKRGKGIAQQR